jgi:hypothetical protein
MMPITLPYDNAKPTEVWLSSQFFAKSQTGPMVTVYDVLSAWTVPPRYGFEREAVRSQALAPVKRAT